MPVTHEPWLVALSVVVAIQGAYVGVSVAVAAVIETVRTMALGMAAVTAISRIRRPSRSWPLGGAASTVPTPGSD